MAVAVVNLTIEKGTDFEATFDVFGSDSSPVILQNYSGVCKIRKHPTALKSFPCKVGIVTATGEVTVSMGKTLTSQLSSGRNYYDVLVTEINADLTEKIVQGSIIVSDSASL